MNRFNFKPGFVINLNLFLLLIFSSIVKAEEPATFFHLMEPYKPVYLLNSWFLNGEGEAAGFDDRELMLQFSFKTPFYRQLFVAFTYKGFWQVYDLSNSRPFREQNYNPEAFIDFGKVSGLDTVRLGLIEHESNGERVRYEKEGEVNYSRTWDRTYLYLWKNFGDYFGLGMKAWVVTSSREDEYQAFYHDNADMQYYMGSGEIYAAIGQYPTLVNFTFRRGWMEKTETYRIEARIPIYHFFNVEDKGYDLYLLYFNGYGDSLIDYNRKVIRFALGLAFR